MAFTDDGSRRFQMLHSRFWRQYDIIETDLMYLPLQIICPLRINLNFFCFSKCPFRTRQPATGTFFFPSVTEKVARIEASPLGREQITVNRIPRNRTFDRVQELNVRKIQTQVLVSPNFIFRINNRNKNK